MRHYVSRLSVRLCVRANVRTRLPGRGIYRLVCLLLYYYFCFWFIARDEDDDDLRDCPSAIERTVDISMEMTESVRHRCVGQLHVRQVKSVRTHLSGLVNKTPVKSLNSSQRLTEDAWRSFHSGSDVRLYATSAAFCNYVGLM